MSLKLLGSVRIDHAIDNSKRILNEQHNLRVKKNRELLKPLIRTTSYLGRQGLPFRGHDESETSANKGNYREMCDTLYEDFDGMPFDSPIFNGQSSSIQNDMILSFSTLVRNVLFDEIKSVDFCSWQVDETTDINVKSQLSVIFRYVVGSKICERFMGFFDVSNGRNAEALCSFLEKEMDKFDFKNKLIGQTYDGAAVMASELNGLQAKIKKLAKSALFLHCYAHNMNLVLSSGTINIIKRFFSAILADFQHIFQSRLRDRIF